jgi:hypothetical protein
MAASVMAAAPAGLRPPSTPPRPPQGSPPLPIATHPFVPGSVVVVQWADGNRYPGTVLQAAPHHVFIVFPNGVQQWVDARYVSTR